MKIIRQDLERLIKACLIDLSEEEKRVYLEQLNDMLGYVDSLNKLDTDSVEPLVHVLPQHNVFREDKLQPSLDRSLVLANAPEEHEGTFVVPRIV